jgi:uncharacterized protein YpmS
MRDASHRRISAMLSFFLCLIVVVPAWVHAAEAEPDDIDDNLRAKIQKEKVKTSRDRKTGNEMENSGMEDISASNSNCDINIGNQTAPQKGSNQIAARDQTVIVTGPVVNTGNCSKH